MIVWNNLFFVVNFIGGDNDVQMKWNEMGIIYDSFNGINLLVQVVYEIYGFFYFLKIVRNNDIKIWML